MGAAFVKLSGLIFAGAPTGDEFGMWLFQEYDILRKTNIVSVFIQIRGSRVMHIGMRTHHPGFFLEDMPIGSQTNALGGA